MDTVNKDTQYTQYTQYLRIIYYLPGLPDQNVAVHPSNTKAAYVTQ